MKIFPLKKLFRQIRKNFMLALVKIFNQFFLEIFFVVLGKIKETKVLWPAFKQIIKTKPISTPEQPTFCI